MRKPSVLKTLLALAFTLWGAVTVNPASAAGTPAGTVIENRADLVYTPEGGTPKTLESTPVQTTVIARCAISVLPNGTVAAPGQSYSLLPGESAVLKYSVTNNGNAQNTVTLSVRTEPGSQFSPGSTSIYIDSNSNGLIDPGEAAVTTLTLAADAQAAVLVKVNTTQSARGNTYPNLVSSCGTNQTGNEGELDDNNVALITVGEPPALGVTKTFTGSNVRPGAGGVQEIRPGEEFTVNIVGTNTGVGASRAVTITDFLNTTDMQQFVYVSGSARLSGLGVIEYSNNGSTWSSSETSPVAAIRARTDSLASGASLTLTFNLRAPATDVGVKRNIAILQSSDLTLEAPADINVRYTPSIALGPIGNPEALPGGELSANDKQCKQYGVLNQEVCFPQTVKNLGDRPDTLTITGKATLGQATIRYTETNGTPITEPFVIANLAPQESKDFNVCVTPTKANNSSANEALMIELKATSANGATQNFTLDCIVALTGNNLNPLKDVDVGSGKVVEPGQTLTYTLTFKNEQAFDLKNVVIRDNLQNIAVNNVPGSAALEFIRADAPGVLEGTTVVWRYPTVTAGQTLTLKLVVRVPNTITDGAVIRNVYTVTSDEITTPVESPEVPNPVFTQANLSLTKTSSPQQVALGGEVTYIFTVKNNSTTGALTEVKVNDTLPTGLTYVEGSSTLDGTEIIPTVSGRTYTWTIPGLAPGATAVVKFRALVNKDATSDQLKNTALATAISNGGEVKGNESSNTIKVDANVFKNYADVVGYVFLDMNRNGIYNRGVDIPCQNARVILANGRIVHTDAQGRYHFGSVQEGTVAIRLDPNSVAVPAMNVPQDAGRTGSRLVYVRNLTSVDFPLIPNGGDLAVVRDTTLRITSTQSGAQSSLTVRKQVFTTDQEGVYRVQLILNSLPELQGVTLTDPLPEGATLLDGQNVLTYDTLPSGELAVTYRFRWTGDPKGAVTDPTASWRY